MINFVMVLDYGATKPVVFETRVNQDSTPSRTAENTTWLAMYDTLSINTRM